MVEKVRPMVTDAPVSSIHHAFSNKTLTTNIIEGIPYIDQIDGVKYYYLDDFLLLLKEIRDLYGEVVIFDVGKKIFSSAVWPIDIKNLESALQSIDAAYNMNHKFEESIGNYTFEKIDDRTFHILCDNPYPCSFDRGIITCVSQTFEKNVTVKHLPGSCRENGDLFCVYEVISH